MKAKFFVVVISLFVFNLNADLLFAQQKKTTPAKTHSKKKTSVPDSVNADALYMEFWENVAKRAEKMGGLKTTTKEKKDKSGHKYVEVETSSPDPKILKKAMEEEINFMMKHPKTPLHAEYAKMMKKVFLEGKLTELLPKTSQPLPSRQKKKAK